MEACIYIHTQWYTRVTGVVLLMKMKREKKVLQYDLGKTFVFPQWTLLFLLPYNIIYRLVPSSFSEYFYFNFSLNSAAIRYRAIQPFHCPSEKNRFSDCLKLMRARLFMFPIIKMLRDNDTVATIQKSKREAPSI